MIIRRFIALTAIVFLLILIFLYVISYIKYVLDTPKNIDDSYIRKVVEKHNIKLKKDNSVKEKIIITDNFSNFKRLKKYIGESLFKYTYKGEGYIYIEVYLKENRIIDILKVNPDFKYGSIESII